MTWQFGTLTIRADGLESREAFQYGAQLLGMLTGLDAIRTGHAVLDAFRFYGKPVLVYPYDGRMGACNALAQGDWGMFWAKVSFTPWLHGRDLQCVMGKSGHYEAGDSPHESLVHELTHAIRAVAGTLSKLPADDEEEIAMLVANIFASETHRPLRARYEDNSAGSDDSQAYSHQYLEDNYDIIEVFHDQHKEFARWLGRVNTAFNPIREYMEKKRPPGW